MKALSIKEPYASLICRGVKTIETRSFKTKYRGELYIHASKTKNNKDHIYKLKGLYKEEDLKPGFIICKCTLSDCIYMDENFIKLVKKNKTEELCGNYAIGRYAWILKDITPLKKPILIKGKLGIWNF